MSSCMLFGGDNVTIMRLGIATESVQLTVTSPPYDNLRTYNGFSWNFENLAKELYRVTKPGGVIVWVVADATVNGSETGTSFRQVLHFMALGFGLHDTMIYRTNKPPINGPRYEPEFEYMFVFSKGKPSVANILREKSLHPGARSTGGMRAENGEMKERTYKERVGETKARGNIWYLTRSSRSGDEFSRQHPATFPDALARDHILSWSNPGDTVLDPFLGSGTTGKMALLNDRNFIGIEISPEYLEIARKRMGV